MKLVNIVRVVIILIITIILIVASACCLLCPESIPSEKANLAWLMTMKRISCGAWQWKELLLETKRGWLYAQEKSFQWHWHSEKVTSKADQVFWKLSQNILNFFTRLWIASVVFHQGADLVQHHLWSHLQKHLRSGRSNVHKILSPASETNEKMSKVFTWVNCPKAVRALALPFAAASSIGVFVSLRPVAIASILHQNREGDENFAIQTRWRGWYYPLSSRTLTWSSLS